MSSLIALCVSIGVLGGVATYLALGPLAGFILIWGIFIGWATFFALGGDTAALKKGITCNVFGVVCAWLMAVILLNTPLGGLGGNRSGHRCWCYGSGNVPGCTSSGAGCYSGQCLWLCCYSCLSTTDRWCTRHGAFSIS